MFRKYLIIPQNCPVQFSLFLNGFKLHEREALHPACFYRSAKTDGRMDGQMDGWTDTRR